MNIDAFWQANRKFIIGLGAGIIAFFILLAVVAGGATDRFSTASISVIDSMAILGPDMSRARVRFAINQLGGVGKKKLKKLEKSYQEIAK